ncbi:helix-turn-helix domain-containing protein [Bifidobacterium adolescentis]|uniref:helix-turn-helix domain-containing protein n=1 Tax=Bifidobacterium adolescentis TaxID=1680 RepID=UPI0022E6F907|nr:helix-turn-helix domain-containing protein [Bifidobacterium adolescentis]
MTMMMGGKVHRTRSKARRSAGGVPGAFLQGVDGTRIPLTPDDYRRVREFLLAEPERAVVDDERITTGEAARILGVSQRTLTRMLDAGMIPYTRMGERSYRFLRLSDVTDYKRRRDEATSKALDEMRSIADEDGAYDIDYSDYLSRFDK